MSQLDEFFADASRIEAEIRAAKSEADAAELALRQRRRSDKVIIELKEANAGNLVMKVLLLRELKKVDPSNPLIQDARLRQQVAASAETVMKETDHWDCVRDFGLNFKVPGR